MFRVVVATYLMFAGLAGPWLCCCANMRLAGHSSQTAAGCMAEVTPAGHGCCHHHQPTGQNRQPAGNKPEAPQTPDQPGCPCQESPSVTTAANTPDFEVVKQFRQRLPSHGLTDLLASLAADHSPFAGRIPGVSCDQAALPFLTSDDILRTLHILRC